VKPGQNSMSLDAPWKPRGIGAGHRWMCDGCNQPRSTTLGSKKIGARKVCKECVDKHAARQAEKARGTTGG